MYIVYKVPSLWVSVKRALPRPETRVLVWLDDVDYPFFGVLRIKNGKAYWGDEVSRNSYFGCVTHWQFLTCPEK